MKLLVLITCVIALAFWSGHTAIADFAMEFFGDAGDSAFAPDSDSLDVVGKTFTMEAWAKATGPPERGWHHHQQGKCLRMCPAEWRSVHVCHPCRCLGLVWRWKT